MSTYDLIERAKAALEGVGAWENYGTTIAEYVGHHTCGTGVNGHYGAHEAGCGLEPIGDASPVRIAKFAADASGLVPELLAEVERLREAGPWTQHVEYQRAMKRERDGGCICDGNPATTNGPEEDCPWHGREYRYWVEGVACKAAEVVKLRGAIETIRGTAAFEALVTTGDSDRNRTWLDILAVIERIEKP